MHGTLFCQSVKYKFLFSYISRPKLNQCLQIVPTSSNMNQNSASCVVTATQYRLFAVFPKAACEVQPAFSSPASTIAETEHRSSHKRKRHFLSRGCQLAGPAYSCRLCRPKGSVLAARPFRYTKDLDTTLHSYSYPSSSLEASRS